MDFWLNRCLSKCILQPLSLLQKGVSLEDSSNRISNHRSRGNRKCKKIGVQLHKHSMTIRALLTQRTSRRTASRLYLGRQIRQCGSGTLLQAYYYRFWRAIRALWKSELGFTASSIRRGDEGHVASIVFPYLPQMEIDNFKTRRWHLWTALLQEDFLVWVPSTLRQKSR